MTEISVSVSLLTSGDGDLAVPTSHLPPLLAVRASPLRLPDDRQQRSSEDNRHQQTDAYRSHKELVEVVPTLIGIYGCGVGMC